MRAKWIVILSGLIVYGLLSYKSVREANIDYSNCLSGRSPVYAKEKLKLYDGGSVIYRGFLYSITKLNKIKYSKNRLAVNGEQVDFERGYQLNRILPIPVIFDKKSIEADFNGDNP